MTRRQHPPRPAAPVGNAQRPALPDGQTPDSQTPAGRGAGSEPGAGTGEGRGSLVVLGALVALLAVLFVGLGIWQLDRLGQVRARNALLRSRLDQRPLDAAELPAAGAAGGTAEDLVLRRVTAAGRYDTDEQVLIRSRQHRGQNGFHVLTPLRQGNGPALLINRGWIPMGRQGPGGGRAGPPADRAAPPAGQVRITGILRESEEAGLLGPRDPPTGELDRAFRIDVERLGHQLPYAVAPLWVQLTDQHPAQSRALPVPAPPPTLGEGPHLSYAVQWFSFAVIAVVGFTAYARRRRV